jgi:hypothetical protein
VRPEVTPYYQKENGFNLNSEVISLISFIVFILVGFYKLTRIESSIRDDIHSMRSSLDVILEKIQGKNQMIEYRLSELEKRQERIINSLHNQNILRRAED